MSHKAAAQYRMLRIVSFIIAIGCIALSEFLDIDGAIKTILQIIAGISLLVYVGASLVLGNWWVLIPLPWPGRNDE